MEWLYNSIDNLRLLFTFSSAFFLLISFVGFINYGSTYRRDTGIEKKMMLFTIIALSISLFFAAVIPSERSLNQMKDSYLLMAEN